MHKFELGEELKDAVTGFRGICLGRTQYYTGCIHYGLCPQRLTKENKEPDWAWYDESRIIKISNGLNIANKTKSTSGVFPNPDKA